MEILWVEITLHPKPILLGLLYRPPLSKNNLEELQHTLYSISSQCIILCGDFNMLDIDWGSISCTSSHLPSSSFCEITKNSVLDQLVTQPTRQNNILDLVLTTHPHLVEDVQVIEELGDSDHQMVRFDVKARPAPIRGNSINIYNFKKANFELFSELISNVPWDTCFLSHLVEESWTCFKDLLLTAANLSIPRMMIRPSRKLPSYLSDSAKSEELTSDPEEPNPRKTSIAIRPSAEQLNRWQGETIDYILKTYQMLSTPRPNDFGIGYRKCVEALSEYPISIIRARNIRPQQTSALLSTSILHQCSRLQKTQPTYRGYDQPSTLAAHLLSQQLSVWLRHLKFSNQSTRLNLVALMGYLEGFSAKVQLIWPNHSQHYLICPSNKAHCPSTGKLPMSPHSTRKDLGPHP